MFDRLSLIVQVCGTRVSKVLSIDNTDNNIDNIRFGTTCIRYSKFYFSPIICSFYQICRICMLSIIDRSGSGSGSLLSRISITVNKAQICVICISHTATYSMHC